MKSNLFIRLSVFCLMTFQMGFSYADVLAKTNDVTLNGEKLKECSLIEELIPTESGNTHRKIKVEVKNNKTSFQVPLFRINEEGEYYLYYYRETLTANKLSEAFLKNGFEFVSSNKKIQYDNGSDDREFFEVKMGDNDLTKVKKIAWGNGASKFYRALFSSRSKVHGETVYGNDLVCNFED